MSSTEAQFCHSPCMFGHCHHTTACKPGVPLEPVVKGTVEELSYIGRMWEQKTPDKTTLDFLAAFTADKETKTIAMKPVILSEGPRGIGGGGGWFNPKTREWDVWEFDGVFGRRQPEPEVQKVGLGRWTPRALEILTQLMSDDLDVAGMPFCHIRIMGREQQMKNRYMRIDKRLLFEAAELADRKQHAVSQANINKWYEYFGSSVPAPPPVLSGPVNVDLDAYGVPRNPQFDIPRSMWATMYIPSMEELEKAMYDELDEFKKYRQIVRQEDDEKKRVDAIVKRMREQKDDP